MGARRITFPAIGMADHREHGGLTLENKWSCKRSEQIKSAIHTSASFLFRLHQGATLENLLSQGTCQSTSRQIQLYPRGHRTTNKVVWSGGQVT